MPSKNVYGQSNKVKIRTFGASLVGLYKTCDPMVGHSGPRSILGKKLGRGLLGDDTYQISKLFVSCFPYISLCDTQGGAIFSPSDIIGATFKRSTT